MKEVRARTLDAKLDEVRINVRRVTNHIVATVEERRGRALVKQTVFSQTKMFQTIPLGAGLGVLGEAHYSISFILATTRGTNNMQNIVVRSTTMSLENDMVLGRLATEHWLQTGELFKPSRTIEWGFMIVPC